MLKAIAIPLPLSSCFTTPLTPGPVDPDPGPRDPAWQTRRMLKQFLSVAMLAAILPARMLIAGHVATDGTVGAATTLTGPNFSIPATLGRQVGPNLFHSFNTFSLDQGETATFTASASTKAILARVTGGSVSTINGTIATRLDTSATTPHPAAFYLINPAGVIFGPNAVLDVGGSFVVTTADTVELADGGHFDASNPAASLLTSAAPAAFGFVKVSPVPVTVNGSALAVPVGQALSIVGGSGTTIQNATLTAAAGRINVLAVNGSGNITGDPADVAASLIYDALLPPGDVAISGSALNVSGLRSGAIGIRAANLGITNSTLKVFNSGSTSGGGGIFLDVSDDLNMTGSTATASASGTGDAGDILVTGNNIFLTGSSILSGSSSAGGGGSITMTAANTMDLLNGSHASSITSGSGNAGNLIISAHDILIDAGSTGLDTGLLSATAGAGNAGTVTVSAINLTLQNGFSSIFSLSDGAGNAESVTINAANIAVNQLSTTGFCGIATETFSGGNAGVLTINTSTLTSAGGGFAAGVADFTGETSLATGAAGTLMINASTSISLSAAAIRADTDLNSGNSSSAPPGRIVLTSPSMTFTNGTFISTNTNSAAAGGAISLTAANLTLSGLSTVNANTTGSGKAGDVTVAVSNRLTLAGEPSTSVISTGLFTNANGGTGAGGNLLVSAGSIYITGPNSGIEANSFSAAPGGNISINAGTIDLDRQDFPSPFLTGIAANAQSSGNAGTITVSTGTLDVVDGATIATNTFGVGSKAGSITVNATGKIAVHGSDENFFSSIGSSSSQTGAGGGDVALTAHSILVRGKATLEAVSGGSGPAGNVRLVATRNIALGQGGSIDIAAVHEGGDIDVLSRRGDLSLRGGALVVAIAGAGGNINLNAANLIAVRKSGISAHSVNSGGQITIGQAVGAGVTTDAAANPLPQAIILNTSLVDGLVENGTRDLPVRIRAKQFLVSSDSRILSDAATLAPEYDIAGSLVPLTGSLALPGARLIPQCGVLLDEPEVSSFIVTGFGGAAGAGRVDHGGNYQTPAVRVRVSISLLLVGGKIEGCHVVQADLLHQRRR